MTGRPVTPAQQAAAVGIIAAERCRDVHPIRSVVCHACRSWGQHVAAALAAAGVLTDPDTHDRDAVVAALVALTQRERELRSLLRRRAALTPDHTRGLADGIREAAAAIRAALDGAGTDAHGEGA